MYWFQANLFKINSNSNCIHYIHDLRLSVVVIGTGFGRNILCASFMLHLIIIIKLTTGSALVATAHSNNSGR